MSYLSVSPLLFLSLKNFVQHRGASLTHHSCKDKDAQGNVKALDLEVLGEQTEAFHGNATQTLQIPGGCLAVSRADAACEPSRNPS